MTDVLKYPNRWKPGESGNPAGRPVGARGRFTEAFVADITDAWHKHGAGIVEQMATTEPMRFAELCARLIPKDVQVSLSARLPGNLEPDDWQLVTEVMGAIRQALPEANQRQPGEVMQFVLDAIRAHDAKLIESDEQ
jgi:hypothetical protein